METNNTLPGIINDASNASSWLLFILGFALLALGLFLVYYYLTNKGPLATLKFSVQSESGWSFRGFWGRYKGPIIVFIGALILILAAMFIFGGLVGIEGFGDTTYV